MLIHNNLNGEEPSEEAAEAYIYTYTYIIYKVAFFVNCEEGVSCAERS